MKASDLRGWLDYDRGKLHLLPPDERVAYFEKRVRYVALHPLRRILTRELDVPGAESSALLIFGVSLCCAIEACGKFLMGRNATGRDKNAQRFHSFVRNYMSPEFARDDIPGVSNAEVMWKHFRHGLAHGFAVCHGGFEGTPTEPYFKTRVILNQPSLEVNPTRLLDDFERAVGRYLADVRSAPGTSVWDEFQFVFEDVFIDGN